MTGKLFTNKQYFVRLLFEKKKYNKLKLQIISHDIKIPFGFYYNYLNEGKINSKSNFHAKCNISGRSKANFNKFKLSRMIFKRFSEFGLLNGVRKSSW
jgi:ribosomal protein S14